LLGLVATRVLEQDSATPDLFRFRHELLRDVAYELLPPSRRKSAHSRLADNLLRQGPDAPVLDWQVLAAHFERADRAVEAAEAWEQAAEEARRRGALGEARALLGRAIALVAPSDDDTARRREVQLHLRRGFLATSEEGNSSPEAARDFERCLSLIGAETDSEELFRTLVVLWGHYAARAELARARQILDLIRRQLRDEREFFIPFNTAGYGMLDWFAGDFVGALGLLEEAADTSSRTFAHEAELVTGWYMPADPRAAIHTHLALARFVAGDLRGALGELDQASIRVAERDFPAGAFSAAYASSYEAWLHMESGNYDEAASVLDRMLRHSMHHGFASWTIVAASEQATLAAIRAIADPSAPPADLRGHAATMEGIVSTWRSAETNIFLPFYITIGGAAAARAGDLDKAAELFDHSLTFARHRDMGFYDAETLRRSAHLASDPQAVESRLLEALDLAQRQGARIFQLRICRDLYALGGEPSRALLVEAVRGFPPTTSYPELDDARRHLGDGR
jgi:tetratricopeptide (TPR) repeat protein